MSNLDRNNPATTRTVTVTLFKASGKYYTVESWRIPRKVTNDGRDITYISAVKDSPDFHRVDHGKVLVNTEAEFDGDENFGFPHLF